jgi:hypothetical protein
MYEAVKTGPLYDKVVQLMSTYRSVAARMGGAKASTQGKLDRRLQQLAEKIGERLGELSVQELQALDCWKYGILPDTYEVDHDAITERPYISIRTVRRYEEEYDVAERRALLKAPDTRTEEQKARDTEKLKQFLKSIGDNDEL